MLFFNFCCFHFSKFQMSIVKNLMEKPSFFIMHFEGSYEVLLHHKFFWSTHFWQWNDRPFKNFFEIFTEIHPIFLKWKKYYNPIFDDTFKYIVVHYANLNSRSINKPFLNWNEIKKQEGFQLPKTWDCAFNYISY